MVRDLAVCTEMKREDTALNTINQNNMADLFLIDVLMWMFLSSLVILVPLAITEEIVQKLPDSNKFKKWWRRNIISHFPYDSY